MPRPLITLTTDFGESSPYVGQMKGAILSRTPEAAIVDITHGIGPQNIREGALVLADAAPHFPAGTIHIAVIDPGVGTARQVVLAAISGAWFIAPNNGLLGLVARREKPSELYAITEPEYWREGGISATFHGRDVMGPVAAHLARGTPPGAFGPPLAELAPLDWPEPRREGAELHGEVLWIDRFGNAITNIEAGLLESHGAAAPPAVESGGKRAAWVATYGEAAAGSLVALLGSSARLELAVVNGSAAGELGLHAGSPVVVQLK